MSTSSKDNIYIDIDDDITTIIDRVSNTKSKIAALVLPKRASMLQSTVNMKLLKRTADELGKRVVLITSDPSLLSLAGLAGLHVAKTLQSKPQVPAAPLAESDLPIEAGETELEDVEIDKELPVGALAGLPNDPEETIELDNEASVAAAAVTQKLKPNKRLKVPSFEKFRLRLILGTVIFIGLIVGWFVCFTILPKSRVVIKTDNMIVTTKLSIVASPSAKALDNDKKIIPASLKELPKTDSEKVATSGTRDDGTKATGSVTLSLTDCSQDKVIVPVGTAVSANSLSFTTQTAATLVSTKKGGVCKNDSDATATVAVIAQNAGDKYNLGSRPYQVSNLSNVSASGTNMIGGTSKITKLVSQTDIDAAKQKILGRGSPAASEELQKQLAAENYLSLVDTLQTSKPMITSAPNVNEEGSDVTVTLTISYTMVGMKKDDLKTLVENDIKRQIDSGKQNIIDNGIDKGTVHVVEAPASGETKLTFQSTATAGARQDVDAIKRVIAGKKKGEAVAAIQNRPGIKDVNITYSPFWVASTPKKLSKITVTFEQPTNVTPRP